jgi:hypothetical protein
MLTGSSSATDTEDVWRRSRSQLGRAPTRRAWLYPVADAVFGGVRPAGQEQHRDLRDWAAIRNWAADTATQGQRHQPRGLKNEELDHGGNAHQDCRVTTAGRPLQRTGFRDVHRWSVDVWIPTSVGATHQTAVQVPVSGRGGCLPPAWAYGGARITAVAVRGGVHDDRRWVCADRDRLFCHQGG